MGIPNNLMPYVQQVALGQRSHLSVFGSDYPTRDGTCVRQIWHPHIHPVLRRRGQDLLDMRPGAGLLKHG